MPLPALDVVLQSPLTTVVSLPVTHGAAAALSALIEVPADAPGDLGIGAWVADRDGHWYQVDRPGHLVVGRERVDFPLDAQAGLVSEPGLAHWNADAAAAITSCGFFFYSAARSHVHLHIADALVQPTALQTAVADPVHALLGLQLQGLHGDLMHGASGACWSASVVPQPFPANPYDPSEFTLDAEIHGPQGRVYHIPGFYYVPMAGADRGDRASIHATGAGSFQVRFRPYAVGRYTLQLRGHWRHDAEDVLASLPDLHLGTGIPDPTVHIDAQDPRFFCDAAGGFVWPVGLNLHSPFDLRSRDSLGTRLTPDRGYLVYDAMLPRLAAAGGDACEIWMSSWNVGLEWRADWPSFQGIGRYSQVHAWELDQILDRAWSQGIRVNLVINNHGQASANADREWHDNPWNARLGGPLEEPIEVFLNPQALQGQEQLRRYIIARWADHPAVLGWKLWSEVDLTAAKGDVAWLWHEQAAARWHALDPYHHPVTTHWAGDFRRVNPAVALLPGIDYLCIDAYRHPDPNGAWRLLANILCDSATFPGRGLAMYGKPIVTTEFGAGAGASPEACRLVDHRTAAWAALVAGQAASPMLWWWEWVDQYDRWQPFIAIRRFIAGEDLRGGRSAILDAQPNERLWSRAWVRPGRILGYLLDARWGEAGAEDGTIAGAQLQIGDQVAAGSLTIEWWDPDSGALLSRLPCEHRGGQLELSVPPFSHHLAFKMIRQGELPHLSATGARR